MYRYRKNKKRLYFTLLFLLAISIGVGYAYLTSNLKINGTTKISKNTWDIHFQDVTMINNTVSAANPTLTSSNTVVTFSPTLKTPGDEYSFSVKVVNAGSIDAMLSEVVKAGVSTTQAKYTEFSVTYLDGTAINVKDKLGAGESLPLKVVVRYKDDITAADLPSSNQTLSLSMTLTYVQADSSANEVKMPDFATDSWEKIISVVQSGGGSLYEVGDTKEVDMGTFGTHTLRIANTSTPDECATEGFSQTACGFVLEFADIITTRVMNSTNTNAGGWPASELYTYVQNDIYNALPKELKAGIIETTVVSGHGSSDSANFTSTDKLYLLSTKEVWGKEGTSNVINNDTIDAYTRQLDYYKAQGVTTSNKSGAIKQYNGSNFIWWLRAASSNYSNYFYTVMTLGDCYDISAYNSIGVAPAFRIG